MSPRISISLLAAQSDQRLVALAREGHERAFEALVHRYRRPLLRYARRMGLPEARAEDVLQQAFMQSWIALSRGANVHDVRSWLFRIVHNVAVNVMRGPAEAHGELTQAVQDRAGLAGVSNIERTIAVRDALGEVAALPAMQRQAIFLTAVDGQSHEQVAGTLGITPGALRGLLYRARSTLRSAAAALIPPPVLAWACDAGSSAPMSERLAELSAAGGGAGMAGLFLKGAVVAVTASAVATGASVLSVHGGGVRHHGPPAAASQALGPRSGSSSFALASQPGGAGGSAGVRHRAFGQRRSGVEARRGEHGARRSRGDAQRQLSSSDHRGGEQSRRDGRETLASDGGGRRLSSASGGSDGSGDARSGGGRDATQASGGGQLDSSSGSGGDGSSHGGSGDSGSGASTTSLAASSPISGSGDLASTSGSGDTQPAPTATEETATTSDGHSGSDG
jgi:RNA polymerase sigma factor (sigma-70 family)